MTSEDQYAAQWRDLQSRMTTFFAVWIGGFIGIGLTMAIVSSSFGEPAANVVAIALFVVWAIAFFVTGSRWSYFRCPRCGEHFFKSTLYVNQLGGQCLHCGLPKWSKGE